MAINFEEDLIRVEYVIGEDTITETVTGEVEVPANKPDIERIIEVTAEITDYQTEIEEGGVNLTGTIVPGIIYVADVPEDQLQQPVHFFGGEEDEAVINFTNFVDIPDAESGMNVFADVNVRRVSYNLVTDTNGTRAVEVTVVISKFVKVTEYRQITVITDVTGIPEEDITEELLKIDEVIGESTVTTTVSGRIDRTDIPENKPPIERVLNSTAEITSTTTDVEEDSVIVDGTIEGGIIYVAEVPEDRPQQPVHFLEGEFNFSEVIDIPGVQEGMTAYINAQIVRVSFDFISEDVVEIDVVIELFVKVTETRQVNVIVDIVSDRVEVERELLRVEDVVGEDTEFETITGNLNVPAEKPDIERVLEVSGRILEFEAMTENDGVMIEGVVEGDILYVADVPEAEFQQPVHYFEGTLNFDNFVQIPGTESDMNNYVEVEVQRTSYNVLNTRTVEFTAVLRKFAKVTEFRQLEIITDVVVISPAVDDECPPSYIVYVIQKGDTLWKISRRYNTTVEALLEANPDIQPENLQVGDKICVPEEIVEPKG
ncbi:MAG: DUF3794 and LysM peptidoglycan-binding domain-containing protein [Halanaerobiales bacterium]